MKLLGSIFVFLAKVFRFIGARLLEVGTSLGGTLATKDTKSLAGLNPRFAVFFDGDETTLYQIQMWIKPFEQVGEEWIIITKRPRIANFLQNMTSQAKVVIAKEKDNLVKACNLPSLKLIMYVNNARENSEAVRFPHLTHAQLMHGDSEKTASFNPVSGMFTKIFVAGQAGIDRYERNGVMIHPAKFEIVGRPQLQAMDVIDGPINPERPTVLVAPTWGGSALGEQLSSLSTNPELVSILIAKGARVVFRPHPFCKNSPEGQAAIKKVQNLLAADNLANNSGHVYGSDAETKISVNEAANLSHMIVSDLSGIMSDWLFSLKPYLLVSMDQSAKDFAQRYPMGRAGFVVDGRESKDFESAVRSLISTDTQEAYEARKQMREYYLAGANDEDRTALFTGVVKKLIA